jgi:RNA polymerase sigma factor (sigma-70 family)
VGEAQSADFAGEPLPVGANASEAERFFLQHLPTIERIVAFVCRRNRISGAEADDVRSLVQLKLIENNYEALRRFRGQSSLRTYLTVVIQRRFLDYRISEWGKWRPSAEARRLGALAIELERLTSRDGLSRDEAIESLATRSGEPASREELLETYRRLPERTRKRFVGEERAESIPAIDDVEREVSRRLLEPSARKAGSAVRAAVAALPPQDRLILKMRFEQGFTVAEIAATLKMPQKPLYRRIDTILGTLRERLESEGMNASEVSEFLGTLDSGPSPMTGSGG